VLTVHDLSFLREPGWFKRDRATYYRSMIGRSVQTADRILADSEATASDLREFLRVPSEKIDVILLGVDPQGVPETTNADSAIRAKYGLDRDYFLYLGTIEPRKNLPRVVEAFDQIAGDIDVDLVIAGRPGWRYASTMDAIEHAHSRERIRRIGFVPDEDAPSVLRGATAFVWPSLWEGFGLPPLEAMAQGVPVLTSNISSLPEVVGDAAVTVDPEDVDAIALGMCRIATDAELRARLIEAGLARAVKLTWDKTARETLAAYRRTLDGA
jgi:glycosyltransferase involved in cell wall biosynthesis